MSDIGTTMLKSISGTTERLVVGFGTHVPLLAAALVVLVLTWWIAGMVFVLARRVLARTSTAGHVDLLVARFARGAVLAVGTFVALGVVGVNLGALIASLGLVGLTISLALRDVLANYVSGVMLLMQGPFRVGDTIAVEGMEGTVEDITARTTTLRAADGRQIHIPNMAVFAATVVNMTAYPVRRFEVSVPVPAEADLDSARVLVLAAVTGIDGVLPQPAADTQVAAIGASWARVVAHGWVDTTDSALDEVQAEALIAVGRSLREAGFARPRPPSV